MAKAKVRDDRCLGVSVSYSEAKRPRAGSDRYLDLLKKCLTGMLMEDDGVVFQRVGQDTFFRQKEYLAERRLHGDDWPVKAVTMVGWIRLAHLQKCVEGVIAEKIPGDLLEAGVWRGGASILMRAVLAQHGDPRRVWVCDSFEGLPKPDEKNFPLDAGDGLWNLEQLSVSLSEVQDNFRKYDLLDKQVCFLKGWFKDTMAAPPIKALSILRVDCDLYESTFEVLNGLYDKVSPGGYVIIDDYHAAKNGRIAVDEFRKARGIREKMHDIDWSGSYWRKSVLGTAARVAKGRAAAG